MADGGESKLETDHVYRRASTGAVCEWNGVGYFAEYGKTVNEFRDEVQKELNGGAEVAAINDQVARIEEMEQRINDLERRTEELENPMIYNYIDSNMPEWARATVQKLVDKGYLKGNDKSELGLTDEMLKLFVINDRAGMYD